MDITLFMYVRVNKQQGLNKFKRLNVWYRVYLPQHEMNDLMEKEGDGFYVGFEPLWRFIRSKRTDTGTGTESFTCASLTEAYDIIAQYCGTRTPTARDLIEVSTRKGLGTHTTV